MFMSECMVEKKALAENIESLSNFSELALRKFEIPEDRRQELLMALDEAITNIVMHSYGEEKGNIKIVIREEGKCVEVELIDSGKLFDPTRYPEPDLNVPLEERQAGGMGVPLIRKLTDGMKYYHRDGNNHFILTKNIGGRNG